MGNIIVTQDPGDFPVVSDNVEEAFRRSRWTRPERTAFASVACILLVLLGIASWMTPNPTGVGTHQQLGLPGCTMLTIVGMRCPACGMTTSWAHTLDGNLVSGIGASLSGVLMCLTSLVLVPAFFWFAVTGKSWIGFPFGLILASLLVSIASISAAEWLIRLAVS